MYICGSYCKIKTGVSLCWTILDILWYNYLIDVNIASRLWSASTSSLPVRRTRLSTVAERAFPIAAAQTRNALPRHVTSAPSLPVFCSRLKTHSFGCSFPWLFSSCDCSEVNFVIIGHFDRSYYLLTYVLTYLRNIRLSCVAVNLTLWLSGRKVRVRIPAMPLLSSNLGQVVYSQCLSSLLSSKKLGYKREYSDWTDLTA